MLEVIEELKLHKVLCDVVAGTLNCDFHCVMV